MAARGVHSRLRHVEHARNHGLHLKGHSLIQEGVRHFRLLSSNERQPTISFSQRCWAAHLVNQSGRLIFGSEKDLAEQRTTLSGREQLFCERMASVTTF